MGLIPERQIDLKVSNLLFQDGSDWNKDAIQRCILQEEENILMIKPSKLRVADRLI